MDVYEWTRKKKTDGWLRTPHHQAAKPHPRGPEQLQPHTRRARREKAVGDQPIEGIN